MGFLYFFGLKQNFEERVLGIEILSKVVFFLKKTREKQKLDFFLNEKHNLWYWDCSMSGFPKGFRISKASLVNVFRKGFFLMQHAMQCKGETNKMI